MTTPASGTCPVLHGSPTDGTDEPRYPLYAPAFCADPHRAYSDLRGRYGSLAPIELSPGVPATLVLGYSTALEILRDPDHFPADPRSWQETVPEDCPVLPMMRWFPAARYSDGPPHTRYRQASVASLDGTNLHALGHTVGQIAEPLIEAFGEAGSAELVSQYAFPLVCGVLNQLVGCSEELGHRVARGMAARFDGSVDAAWGMKTIKEALMELIALKRAEPGDDITSRLAKHPAGLDDVEMFAQLMSFYGAGSEAQGNLIINAVRLMLTDDRFGGALVGGTLDPRDALDEVLFNDPPMANFCMKYPRQPILKNGIWLPKDQPVVISLAACNNDPKIFGEDRVGNRSHLAWSVENHACPARRVAYLTVETAIIQLLDMVPEMRLAVPEHELEWRPGPFHRALTKLPVTLRR
ncbi:cytochrome P450 [Nocardia sp. CA-120079]|uniref:cytochrome P450 n=1 Tax=Nocardia sp. CA-120079 TaxID=3239974 RepID=UPI003D96DB9A